MFVAPIKRGAPAKNMELTVPVRSGMVRGTRLIRARIEAMQNILDIVQIVLAAILITAVLLQNKGTGLGSAFGGGENVYRTKRGFEKTLFIATIVVSVLFFGTALANVLVQR